MNPIHLRWLAGVVLIGLGASTARADFTNHFYDDGVSNATFGPPSSFAAYGNIDMLWGNYFFTDTPAEAISHVEFGLGDLSASGLVSVWIFEDPDDDADPTNAVPVFNTTTPAADLSFMMNQLDIPPTPVAGGFFVAIGHLAELVTDGGPHYPHPARLDPDGPADKAWFFYDSDIPENDLGDSAFFQRMDGPEVPLPGVFAIRVQGETIPEPATGWLLAAASAAAWLRRRPIG